MSSQGILQSPGWGEQGRRSRRVEEHKSWGRAGMVVAITLSPQPLRAADCRDVTDQVLGGRFRELED